MKLFKVLAILIATFSTSQCAPLDLHPSNDIHPNEIIQKGGKEVSNQFSGEFTHLQKDPFEPVNLLDPVTQVASNLRTSRAIGDGKYIPYLTTTLSIDRINIQSI